MKLQTHPNRRPFTGILTRIDEVSDKAPSGSRGHRVLLRRDAAVAALPTLTGMAVDFRPDWDGHDPRSKCGVIESAFIDGKNLCVRGYIYARDFPEVVVDTLNANDMGMSFEMYDAHVNDMRAAVWVLNRATFAGAAILLRERAAFTKTRFFLGDSNDSSHSGISVFACVPSIR